MSAEATPQRVPLIYPFMLVTSVTVAALFCYLYLTADHDVQPEQTHPTPKPAIIVEEPTKEPANTTSPEGAENSDSSPPDTELSSNSFTLPSSQALPGEITINSVAPSTMPLAKSEATGSSKDFEQTNFKVQHIIDAKLGDEPQERITIEVPVIYQTRAMRWGPDEVAEARRVLRAMEIYRERVKQLKLDGQNIQFAWEKLLTNSQPIPALRADSPSLPENSLLNQDLSNSSESITISHE